MALYDSCCWCLPLRTGVFIIAIIEIIFQVVANIVFVEMDVRIAVIISGNVIGITFIGLLIYGIILQKRSCLWLWLAIDLLLVILLGLAAVMTVIGTFHPKEDGPDQGAEKLVAVITAVVSTAVITAQIIFGLVVFSYLCKLREIIEREEISSVSTED